MSEFEGSQSYVLEAMQMIVGWYETREMCLHRTSCEGCPAFKGQVCGKKNTDQVLKDAAEIFQDFLER